MWKKLETFRESTGVKSTHRMQGLSWSFVLPNICLSLAGCQKKVNGMTSSKLEFEVVRCTLDIEAYM